MTDIPFPAPATKTPKTSPKLNAAAASAQDALTQLKDAAHDTLDETKARVQSVVADTAEEAQQRYGDIEAYVQLYPVRALGIAAAVGVLAGLLLRGPSRIVRVEPR